MVGLVRFDSATEERVRFVEETPGSEIIEKTLDRLRKGEDPLKLITAAGLAVSRSCELPADHHGGALHPIAGLHAVVGMMDRLSGEDRMLPVLQCVALANKHINMPSTGPSVMVAFDDLNQNVESEQVLARLEKALSDHQQRLAERAVALACDKAKPGQILDSLLTVALRRNNLDDHYLLYTVFAFRALDELGWEWAPVFLRPVARYLSRHHSFDAFGEFDEGSIADGIGLYRRFSEIEALIDTYDLTEGQVQQKASGDESIAIAALAQEIGDVRTFATVPETVARALGAGLSLEGACEALSVGGARVFLRSHSNNPFDVHIHTGLVARRYIIGCPEVRLRHKVLALLGWIRSYEIRYLDRTLLWSWENVKAGSETIPAQTLLAEIERRILAIDGYDVTNLTVPINELVAPDAVREIARLAEIYVKAGYDPEAMFDLTTRLVCREDASEMHAYKLQQAAYMEYRKCRAPHNWVHVVAAVKQAAVAVPMKPARFWPQIATRLAA